MTAYCRHRTGFPALTVTAAGVLAWCKLLATTGLPLVTILGPGPGSTECWWLMWTMLILFCHRHHPQLTRGNRHTAFIYWSPTMPFFPLSYSPRLEFVIHWVDLTMTKLNSLKHPECNAFNSAYFKFKFILRISKIHAVLTMLHVPG